MYHAAICSISACSGSHRGAFAQGNPGVAPDAGTEFGLSGSHRSYDQDAPAWAGKVKMIKGMVDLYARESQAS